MKILKDLLTNPTNRKYSRKSVITMVMFIFVLVIGSYIVIDKDSHQNAIDVFNSSLLFLASLISVSIVDKKIAAKPQIPKEEE